MITNQYSAQYGRNAGAVENYITKSGTNSFHGSGFDLYQSQFLSSLSNGEKNPLALHSCATLDRCTLPRYVENRPGATIGGPVLRNKLFFFFSTYWDRVRTGVAPSESFPFLTPVPGAAGLGAIQSTFAGDPAQPRSRASAHIRSRPAIRSPFRSQPAYAPQATPIRPLELAWKVLPTPMAPHANIQVAGVTRSIASPSNDQEQLARLDWQPTEKDRFFFDSLPDRKTHLGLAGADGIAAGDWYNEPSETYYDRSRLDAHPHCQLRRSVAL